MQEVEVVISGGAVQSVTVPEGVKVVVKDYDVEADDWAGKDIVKDADGDHYQLMEFTENW